MATAVFFHAHPDDEVLTTGGTMAKLASDGHRVVLVTATRGELGELPVDGLAPGERLAQRRTSELASSCAVLGVTRQVFLGYHDSGMVGEPSNEAPGCFWVADVELAARALAAIVRDEGASVLTAYDEHGNYGHPDHIQVHRVGLRAGELAGTPRVFMATINRDRAKAQMGAGEGEFEMDGDRAAVLETIGVEERRITTAVDVSAHVDQKRRAIAAHTSQVSDSGFFLDMPPDLFATAFGTEWYVRVGAAPGESWEDSLLGPGQMP
jgi:LmbE family N-acetylglucosaminyl deacetylase